MADPLPIIGLASSIITFIEFGIRITRTARSIRVAADGKAPEIQELQKNLEEMLVSKQQILDRKDAGRVSGNERQIANTVKECDKLAGEMKEVIDDLTGPRSLFGSGGVAIRVARRRNELDKLRKRLRDQDSKIRECLQHLLDRERHSQLLTELRMIRELHVRHEINQSTDITQLRKDIFEISTTRSDDIETTEAQVTRLRTKLEKLDQEAERQRMQAQVIESLYAGSGKSTLMKYAFNHPQTTASLRKWAGPLDLSCASHFFWNQGFSLEKSQEGLLQSLLYQILKQVPSLALLADPDRPRAEEWKFEQLQSFFGRITLKTSLSTNFCLFIDGLDEYDGDETHIAELISSISQSQHIKVCISTRPRTTFQNLWPADLSMKDFTQNDMKVYVEKILGKSKEFEALQLADPTRDALVNEIAKHAKGVWLWVELVTKDIIQAAKTEGDDPDKFQEILKGFPPDLEEYFKHIISRVNQLYRVEMAKFFLITIFEVQPLPLYAFYLLHHEEKDPDYAVKAEISELAANDAIRVGKDWKEKIKYRCSDLLIVGKDEHPVFLMQPVDFLHRTVRDFLRDWFQDDLYKELKSTFVPPISLCRIMLFFLKKQPQGELNSPKHYNRMIGLVDELLYYAREAEKHDRCGDLQVLQVADILDEVDPVNTTLMKRVMNNHWTHARDPPRTRGYDEYRERGNSNFIALAVQARLVKYVEAKLDTTPNRLSKRGRPLLDYALRPRRVMPIQLPYHSKRDEANIDTDMVKLLLKRKADPNQVVHSHSDRSVWALFLISCWESVRRREATDTSKWAWYQASLMLIEHGARRDCFSSREPAGFPSVENVLEDIFGENRASNLLHRMDNQEGMTPRPWFGWAYGVSSSDSLLFGFFRLVESLSSEWRASGQHSDL
ncbi:hypothetical protein CDV31_011858 [Fusarium ambrosium]|uniref:NACHT domain-containing protein n=1 Tax=Fusarium ambrosium TaxID=131363 RepID=A0A428TDX3_9HYPO|nr:hypothetical protein CDV31_011858 [Fusarium ambrosium]